MRILHFLQFFFITGVFLFIASTGAWAQCATPISTFPYNEGFEVNDGGWVTGGSASDWAWGSPTKPVITAAANGANCWITGGLTGSAYNNSENSVLISPCFDFTTLVDPQISFSIFWETERKYDGANLEYSINGGVTWILLGSVNDNGCTASNWYNNAAVTYLGGANGWSGNIQPTAGSCLGGSGSNGWLMARHDLAFLAGQSKVIFRFRFAAGLTCNSYDGFAIDDINISETPPNSGTFTYTCNGNRNVSFTSTSSACANTYSWDFGDIASGASNTSALPNPSHIFSAAGIYNVILTITYGSGPPVVIPKTIEILDVSINQLIPILCNGGQTAAIVAIVSGGSGSYNYVWNTTPPQTTFDLNNIGSGNYTVVVTSATACPTSASFTVSEPAAINIATQITDATCNKNNGSISAIASGGTAPYSYLWSDGTTATSINNLPAGTYSIDVTDQIGCLVSKYNLVVNNVVTPVNVSLGTDVHTCAHVLVLSPGQSYASYLWQDNTTNPDYIVTQSGTYWVTVTNAAGCSGSDTVQIFMDCSDVYFPGAFTPNGDSKNDYFGPIGPVVSSLTNYTMRVYDRYGELIFYSTDPYKKWDGTKNGSKYNTGTFTWFATYTINGKSGPDMKQGTVILIR
jgi:gliding motility-associated-like protein